MVRVPADLAEVTALREGDAGREWLRELPRIVDAACRRWHCTIEGEPTHGQVALVVPVRHPAGPAVLKVSFPHPGNLGEADALRIFAGRGAVTLLEVDHTGLVLVLERALPHTLAGHVARGDCPVEEAIEVAGDLAHRLAVDPLPGITPLAQTTRGWKEQLHDQVRGEEDGEKRKEGVERRESWLTIDPKGWFGTAAFDAFTVVAGGRDQLRIGDELHAAVVRRVSRFAAAARVDLDLALACCQARAVSSYLDQLTVPRVWFDAEFLKVIALGSTAR